MTLTIYSRQSADSIDPNTLTTSIDMARVWKARGSAVTPDPDGRVTQHENVVFDSSRPIGKAQADDELAARLNAVVDAEYPVPDSPHTSVIERATDNRAAMWRGINAARKIFAPEAPTEPLCPACQGSGEGVMMEGQGPDAYEVPCACPYCKGSGGLLDAYHGLVALLDAEREKYLRLCGKHFFAGLASTGAAPEAPASEQQAGEPTCAMCNDSGIVGYPPDQYEECPDCIKARAATTASASRDVKFCAEAGVHCQCLAGAEICQRSRRATAPSRNAAPLTDIRAIAAKYGHEIGEVCATEIRAALTQQSAAQAPRCARCNGTEFSLAGHGRPPACLTCETPK